MSQRVPSGWQGPLRAAVAVFAIGFLVVWLVKPIGNPCPDLALLPQGSSASSSPSFSPPGSRTCTYTAAGGTKAMAGYVPWLDWIVLLLLAAVAGAAVRVLAPDGRRAREDRPSGASSPRAERPPRAEREPRAKRPPRVSTPPAEGLSSAERPPPASPPRRAEREPRPPRPARAGRAPKPGGRPRASPGRAAPPPSAPERDAAERERARQERAARDRSRRGR